MSLYSLMNQSPNDGTKDGRYYGTKGKLLGYARNKVVTKIKEAEDKRALVDTQEKHKEYVDFMRAKYIENLGYIPYDKTYPLNEKKVGEIVEDDLTIEKVVFESRKGVYVTANVYVPKNREEKSAAVIFVLGHAEHGKACDRYQKVARRIARQGLIVLIYDPTGQGERLNYAERSLKAPMVPATTKDHTYFGSQCLLTGGSPAGYFIADAMRAIDYLESRPDVDSERIGLTGSSGGGTMTCHMMVCDDRIKAAAPGTFFTGREIYMMAGEPQDAEQIWLNSLDYGFDFPDILGCFAPKPCMILAVEYDFFHIEGTEEAIEQSKKFWKLYGSDELHLAVDKSVHAYTDVLADNSARFFGRLFDTDYKNNIRIDVSLPIEDLWCTDSGQVVFDFEDAITVHDENKKRSKELFGVYKDKAREFLTEKMNFGRDGISLHLKYYTDAVYENGLKYVPMMWFSQRHLPNCAYLISDFKTDKPDKITVLLTDNGTKDLEHNIYKIRKLIKGGNAVLVVDLSGMGQNGPEGQDFVEAKGQHGYYFDVNMNLMLCGDSICALHLYEISKMIKMLKEHYTDDISIYAEGRMANVAGLYSLIDNSVDIVKGEYESYSEIIENKYYENYNLSEIILPGIIKYISKEGDI